MQCGMGVSGHRRLPGWFLCGLFHLFADRIVGATDQKHRAGYGPHIVVGLIAVGVASGCAGARYERGVSAFDEAAAPVHLVASDAADSERVRAVITVRAGSAHDPVGYAGLAWTTAQAIADRGADAMTAVDGRVTANVGKELVSFHLEAPATAETALADAVKTMFDLSDLGEADLAESKAVGVQWLTDGLASDTRRLADAAFERWVFEGHPYGKPVEGRVSGRATVDAGDVQRFELRATYAPPSASRSAERSKPRSSRGAVRGSSKALRRRDSATSRSGRAARDTHRAARSPGDGAGPRSPAATASGTPGLGRPGGRARFLSSDPGATMVDLLTREDAAFSIRLLSEQPQAGRAV